MLSTIPIVQIIPHNTKIFRQFPVNWENECQFHLAYGESNLAGNFLDMLFDCCNTEQSNYDYFLISQDLLKRMVDLYDRKKLWNKLMITMWNKP